MTSEQFDEAHEAGEREPRGPAVLVIAVVIAVALTAFLAFRYQTVRAIEYSESDGGRVLQVGADACKGDAKIRAEETDDSVTIHASAERQWFGGQSICEIASVPVQLEQPLGGRTVVDGYTGEQLSKSSPP